MCPKECVKYLIVQVRHPGFVVAVVVAAAVAVVAVAAVVAAVVAVAKAAVVVDVVAVAVSSSCNLIKKNAIFVSF